MTWRVGRKVARNIYRDDEPIAMLATPAIAAEIVVGMNEVEHLRFEVGTAVYREEIHREQIARLKHLLACDVDGACRQCRGAGEVIIWSGGSVATRQPVPCGLCEGRGATSASAEKP